MSLKIDRIQLDIVINGDQSRIRLRELEDSAASLKRELKKLPEGSDEYVRKSAELRKVQAEMDGIINKIGILGLTYKELGARQRELNAIMKNLDPRTTQYKELDEQLQKVNARMKELRGGAQETGISFGKLADGFNRYFGVITAFAASFAGVVLGIRQMVDKFNEFEAKVDELSALTGLAGEDLDWLAEQAKKLGVSTDESGIKITKGATEIVDAYKLMGSAKPELLGNKEALNEVTKQALILAEAAKMETAPAVTALANIMNQFGAPASDAAKYINVLAAGAKEGAAEIPDLSDSIVKFGAAAMQANLSVEESVALVEALAEKGVKGEIAGTGIRNVLLELQKGADDTNPKIVGINKALENLAAKNLSAAEMMKMFGKENYTAAQLLITNRERVEELTKAVTDTNVATEQAVKNTNNNAAALAQAKNAAALTAMEFGQKLAPAMTFSTNGVTMFLKAMMAVIQFVATHIKTIATITAGIIAYTVAVNAQVIAQKAYTLATQIAEKVTKVFNATAKSGPWGWIAAAIVAAVTALAMFSKRTTDAAAAQKLLNDVQTDAKKAIAGEKAEIERLLAIARDEKRSKEDRLAAIKKLNEISPKYLGNLNLENINTEAAKRSTEEYIKTLEKKALVQAAQEKLVELEKEFIDLREQGTGAEVKWYQAVWNTIKAGGNQVVAASNNAMTAVDNYNSAFDELTAKKKALLGILSDAPVEIAAPGTTVNPNPGNTGGGSGDDEALKAQKKIFEEAAKYRLEIERRNKSELEQEEYKYQEELKRAGRKGTEENDATVEALKKEHLKRIDEITKKATDKQFSDAEKALKDSYAKRLLVIDQEELKALQTEGKTKEDQERIHLQYETKRQAETLAHHLLLRQMYVNAGKDTLDIDKQINQDRLKEYENGMKQLEEMQKLSASLRTEEDPESEKNKKLSQLDELYAYQQNHRDLDLLSEQEYLNAKSAINTDYINSLLGKWEGYFGRVQTLTTNMSNIANGLQDLDLQKSQNRLDKEYTTLENQKKQGIITEEAYNKKKAALDEKKANEEKKIKKKYADLAFAMQVAQIIAATAQAAINSYQSLAVIPVVGVPLGIAAAAAAVVYGGIQIAQAKAQRDQVKQLASGQYPVIGASDGKKYNVPYAGKMRTAIYPRPVLVSEQGGEMVVDAETTNDLVVNYPGIVRFIKGLAGKRVPQYADGSLPDVSSGSSSSGSQAKEELMVQYMAATLQVLTRLDGKIDNMYAKVVMDEFMKAKAEYDARQSDITKS